MSIAYPPKEQEVARLRVALDALTRQAQKTAAARNAATSQIERDANERALRAIGPQLQDIIEQLRGLGEEVTL